MRIGIYDFSPSLWPTLAFLAILPVLLALGSWQLGRASFKEDLAGAFDASRSRAPLEVTETVADLDASDRSVQFREAIARGRFDERQLLLDNRTHESKAGYHVLTPLKLGEGRPALMVNRGWHPWGERRETLPDIAVANREREVRGRLSTPPRAGLLLGDDGYGSGGWPRVVQSYDRAAIERVLGYPVAPVLLLMDEALPDGFVRQWKANPGIGPERHRGYAVQWFALALALLAIYVTVNTRRVR